MQTGLIHWYSFVPLAMLLLLIAIKLPALLTLAIKCSRINGLIFFSWYNES